MSEDTKGSAETIEAQPTSQETDASVTDSAGSAKKGFHPDWLTIAIVLVILINVGLYFQTQSKFVDSNSNGRTAEHDPGLEGGPDPIAPPSSGGDGAGMQPPPGSGGGDNGMQPPPGSGRGDNGMQPPPGSGRGDTGMQPQNISRQDNNANPPEAQSDTRDLETLLLTAQGQKSIDEMGKADASLALSDSKREQLLSFIANIKELRNLGASVANISALLSTDQLDYLRANKDSLTDVRLVTDNNPVRTALNLLKPKVVGTSAQANPSTPMGRPEFNPETVSVGLILLDKQTGDLKLTSSQIASIIPYLELMDKVSNSERLQLDQILSEKQIEWLTDYLHDANQNIGKDAHT